MLRPGRHLLAMGPDREHRGVLTHLDRGSGEWRRLSADRRAPHRRTDSHPNSPCDLPWQSAPRQRPQAEELMVLVTTDPLDVRASCDAPAGSGDYTTVSLADSSHQGR